MKRFISIFLTLVLTFLACPAFAADALLINGAGATFPYPLYSKWFSEYRKKDPSVQINYQSIGSGGGIRQFREKTVDFGATDVPMNAEQMRQAGTPVVHVPTTLGAAVLTYHLPGVTKELRFTGELVADLFLGKIENWNDPRIAALNPGVKLPEDSVIIIHRSDGSGTTAVFTDYLSKVSPEWKDKVGAGTAVSWPAGLGGKGNEGVAGLIKQTPGALGYVELLFAKSNQLPYAALQNAAGVFVLPDLQSVTAAADEAVKTMPEDFRTSITQMPGKKSYPISAMTYLLIYQNLAAEKGNQKSKKILEFLNWAITDGQKYAETLFYSPLPEKLVKKIQTRLKAVQVSTPQ